MNADQILIAAKTMHEKAEREATCGMPSAAVSYRAAAKKYRQAAELVFDKKDEYLVMAEECEEKSKGLFVMCKSDAETNNGENSTENNNDAVVIEKALLDEALKELDSLIGLDKVKKKISELILRAKLLCENENAEQLPSEFVFLGIPGTGKATVAKIIAKIYHALGFLQKGHVVEVSRIDLVGGYVGQTAVKTKAACDRALGGVLYVGAEFNIGSHENDCFGIEALNYIIEAMKEHSNELIVILEGYPEPISELFEINPQLKSVFTNFKL